MSPGKRTKRRRKALPRGNARKKQQNGQTERRGIGPGQWLVYPDGEKHHPEAALTGAGDTNKDMRRMGKRGEEVGYDRRGGEMEADVLYRHF